ILYATTRDNGARILVAPECPVLNWNDETSARRDLGLIMDFAEDYSRSQGIMAIRLEPRLELPVPRSLREFGRAPVDLVPRETLYIDLGMTPDELMSDMKPKGRYNISLSERHGVCVTESFDWQISVDRFYTVLKEASQRDGFALEPFRFFQQLAQVLC